MVDFSSGAVVSSSSVVVLVDFPRFRPSVALTLVAVLGADFFAVPLPEAFAAFLAGLSGTEFPLIELLVERGAAASASDVLLGLDDDAVGSTTFFCLLVGVVLVLSAAVFALRFFGAIILFEVDSKVGKSM